MDSSDDRGCILSACLIVKSSACLILPSPSSPESVSANTSAVGLVKSLASLCDSGVWACSKEQCFSSESHGGHKSKALKAEGVYMCFCKFSEEKNISICFYGSSPVTDLKTS